MLAVQAARTGGPDVLEVVDLPVPEPGPGQLRIRQHAIGINFIDTYFRSGLYPMRMPAVLGQEGAGVVDAIGEGVQGGPSASPCMQARPAPMPSSTSRQR